MPAPLDPMFFYDEQIRRFLLQFARIFSDFQVEYGRDQEGSNHTLVRVPVRYGDSSRQVQTIMQQNSASNMPSTPMMTFYVAGFDYDRGRMQNPYYVDKMNVRQRTYDPNTGTYDTTQGNAFTIERLMPVPYKLTLKLDIWTSNTNQKLQLFEQIVVLFNPALEIQSTDNFVDWTSLTVCELVSTVWSSKTVPTGDSDQIDIATMTFALPIWISSPVKVKKLGVVERIIASVFGAGGDLADAITDNDLLLGTRLVITPWDYQVLLINGQLQALRQQQVVDNPNWDLAPADSPPSDLFWNAITNAYGTIRPGISYVKLFQDDGSVVIGTIAYNLADDRFLYFNIDPATLPSDTMSPVDSVINPLLSGPGNGIPPAAVGQRYLLIMPTGSESGYATAWAGTDNTPLIANANDIIEYNGTHWIVSFDSTADHTVVQYVTNITTEIQYKWVASDQIWVKSYQGLYPGGKWQLVI